MPNKNFSSFTGNPKESRKPEPAVSMTEKTANWGGLPGKAQSRDRSGGTLRLNNHPKKEGL